MTGYNEMTLDQLDSLSASLEEEKIALRAKVDKTPDEFDRIGIIDSRLAQINPLRTELSAAAEKLNRSKNPELTQKIGG